MIKQLTLHSGFTMAELVVCTAITGMAFVFAAPALDKGRAGADRLRCENNLRLLSQAQLMYANDHGGFPPTALALAISPAPPGPGGFYDNHGWYSLVGPYIGEPEWAATIDFTVSMSHANNAQARRGGLRLKVHACPADIGLQRNEWSSNTWAHVNSNYVVNAGNTNYGQTDINFNPFMGAPFALRSIAPLATVTDGLSDTLLMSEVVTLPESLVAWSGVYSETQTARGGHVFTAFNEPNSAIRHDEIGYGLYGGLGQSAAEARFLQAGFTTSNWPIAATPQTALATSIAPRSKHPGGINASLCDGSAGFIANRIDLTVWRALSSARGAEYVPATQSTVSAKAK